MHSRGGGLSSRPLNSVFPSPLPEPQDLQCVALAFVTMVHAGVSRLTLQVHKENDQE